MLQQQTQNKNMSQNPLFKRHLGHLAEGIDSALCFPDDDEVQGRGWDRRFGFWEEKGLRESAKNVEKS